MLPFQYDEAVVNWHLMDTHAVSVTVPGVKSVESGESELY